MNVFPRARSGLVPLFAALVWTAFSFPLAAQRHGVPSPPARSPEPPPAATQARSKSEVTPEPEVPPLERFAKMTPEEQDAILSQLPAKRRDKLKRQLERYAQLSEDQRQGLEWFHQLPPESQEALRKAFRKFQRESPERQQAMRNAVGRLRALPDAERQAYLVSPEVKSNFNKNEQQMLGALAGILPHTQ